MTIPSQAVGGGPVKATKIFKMVFNQALASAPKIEAWDNSSTFPSKDASGLTTAKEIFTGTTVNGDIPMLAAWSGGAESDGNLPANAAWHPASATAGSANPNLLNGGTNYVTCTNTPNLGGDIVFNLSLKVAYDATVPSTLGMAHVIQVRYTYTGTPPTVTCYYNDGGTEGTPSWTVFTPGTHGIRYCKAGASIGNYEFTLPSVASETKVSPELWVTT